MPLPAHKTAVLGLLLIGMSTARAIGAITDLTTLVSFEGPNGARPYAGLVRGSDGNLYGTTYQGGTNGLPTGHGTAFRLTVTGTLETLASFSNTNGANPRAALTLGPDGSFFGTTEFGGAAGSGTLFRLTTNRQLTQLASFTNLNGAQPSAKLLVASDGFLYGTTSYGGAHSLGTVFRATTNGQLTTLVSFNQTNGARPFAELIQGPDGNLYGTTVRGGQSGWGTIFKLSTNGALTTLVSFAGTDGANPYGGLVLASNGLLYGTTAYGGPGFDGSPATGDGTVFQSSTSGGFQVLHFFSGGDDGSSPRSSLTPGKDGALYGTTILGGATQWGTVFQITTNGILTTLTSFSYDANGISPYGAVLPGPFGSWYGTTSDQGTGLGGTIFRLDPAGAELQVSTPAAASMAISWSALPGYAYQPQYKTGLDQPGWFNLGPRLTASNNSLAISDSQTPGANRFYRVVLFPPP